MRRQLGLPPTRRQLNPKQLARALARAQRQSWRRRTRTTRLERMLADVRRKPFPGLPLAAAKDIHRKSRQIVESMDKRSMDTRSMLGVSTVSSSNVTSGIASQDTPSGATSGMVSGVTNDTTTVASNEPSSGSDSTSTGSGSKESGGIDGTSASSGSDGRDDDTRSVSNTTEAPRPTDTQMSPATSSAGAADARGIWPEEGSRPLTPEQLREKRLQKYLAHSSPPK